MEMSPVQMQYNFLQGIRESLYKDFDISTSEIERFLNLSQEIFVNEWYRVFEANEAARKRLASLVILSDINTVHPTELLPNTVSVTLPNNCRYVLKEEVTITANDSVEYRIPVVPVNIDYYNKHITNSYKKPYERLFWRIDAGNKTHLIVGNGMNVQRYHVTYLKNPAEIKIIGTPVTCEIAPEFHHEIVSGAVQVAINTLAVKSNGNSKETT